MRGTVLVNFGGPRTLDEVEPFLRALLTDQDVVRTGMPQPLHNFLFKRIAKKRAQKVSEDYASIGGGSPIYADTEAVAEALRERVEGPVLTFHRYLPETHRASLEAIEACSADHIDVFPLFPQFTYATTGSIARLFARRLSKETLLKLQWVKSYPTHPAFLGVFERTIAEYLAAHSLKEEEVVLLFSAHGLPKKFVDEGDLYQIEMEACFERLSGAFPAALSRLSYQSKFGPGEWLRPYTVDVCAEIGNWHEGRGHVLVVPISFTSDHIETLFEIEQEHLPLIRRAGLTPHRLPAPGRRSDWIDAIATILSDYTPVSTSMLVR